MPDTNPGRLISSYVERELRSGRTPNRLISEKSPYLLQHAFNPVDWHPWGPEAFELARTTNRIIFLSIGYSTCYWCHVMEREVFERPDIAKLMNELTVNVKVDREERPDVDRVYMAAVQAMTGSGGWPMSVFLTPDLRPFYGATYIPPRAAGGRPGFPDLLRRIADAWTNERDRIVEAGDRLVEFIRGLERPSDADGGAPAPDPEAVSDAAFAFFREGYDRIHGGFGSGPKFPRPAAIDFLLTRHARTGDGEALGMALTTLRKMADGGMHDHVGGGFHRYSVDGEWRVPHFEKMLYDQAQLAATFLSAFQASADPSFAAVASSILGYVRRDLLGSHGGFFSAEDAESAPDPSRPGVKAEGAFYLWTTGEVGSILGTTRAAGLIRHFGMKESGNALHDPHGLFGGRNILHRTESPEETAAALGLPPERLIAELDASLEQLRLARERRPRPVLDDKVVCAWNGLAISAFARAGRILGDVGFVETARGAASFILGSLRDGSTGTLKRRHRDGEARYDAGLQDYAFLLGGLIDLYEACFDTEWIREAEAVAGTMIRLFADPGGGFYDTPGTDPTIIVRTREDYDGAEPSGGSAAAYQLWRLSLLTANPEWRDRADSAASSIVARTAGRPDAAPLAVSTLGLIRSGGMELIVAGRPGDPGTAALLREANGRHLPGFVMMLADGGTRQEALAGRLPFLRSVGMVDGRAAAYLCRNHACELPVTDPAELGRLLDRAVPGGRGIAPK